MASSANSRVPSKSELDNQLRARRHAAGLSQKQLADMAGITRQAVAAVETGQYSPATSVALQLARALQCRVEDLFSIKDNGEVVEGELLSRLPEGGEHRRARLTRVGRRLIVRPLDGTGELPSLAARADGLIVGGGFKSNQVSVKLLTERAALSRQVAIGGCDPAMFLAAGYLRAYGDADLVPCIMGNGAALAALQRGEIHAAGMHHTDRESADRSIAAWHRNLGDLDCLVVTFAHWEEGLIVRAGNPHSIRCIADLARPKLKFINRERGSGARRLLDRELRRLGIPAGCVKGYGDEAPSHLEVASRVRAGLADAGVGVRAAATIFGLEFIALQRERYDLMIPRAYFQSLAALQRLLDVIVGSSFRAEVEAFGGYDTRETGKVVELPRATEQKRNEK